MNAFEWRRAVNFLAALPREAGGFVLPCLPSPEDRRDFKYAAFAGTSPLPPAFIRRDEMPPDRSQGSYGACVGFAGWEQKEWQERQQGDCPEGGLSPLFLYARCKARDGLAEAGTYPRVAMQVLQQEGICPEGMMPYSLMRDDARPPQPDGRAMEEAKKYRIAAYARLDTVEDIKRAIFEQGPVLAALLVCENFVHPQSGYIDLPEGRWLGGHAVTLCGYDDTREFVYPGGQRRRGFFLLRNHWGSSWGDGDYAWLPYDFVTYRLIDPPMPVFFEAWTAVDLPFSLHAAGRIVLKEGSREVWVDGRAVEYDVAPQVLPRGRMMVSLRLVAEALGCVVNYQRQTGIVEIINPGRI